jgi:hypothetical protein
MPCGGFSVDHSFLPSLRGKAQLPATSGRSATSRQPQHSPLPSSSNRQLSSSLLPTHTLLQQSPQHHRTTASYPSSIIFCPHTFDIHPSTLRIPLRRLTSARYTTLPPSAAVSPVHQSPLGLLRLRHARRLYTKPYRLAGDTRPSPARQIPNEHLTSLSALNIHTLDSYLPPTPPTRTTTTPHRPR